MIWHRQSRSLDIIQNNVTSGLMIHNIAKLLNIFIAFLPEMFDKCPMLDRDLAYKHFTYFISF
jgi:hypothetical protein